MKATGIVRRIDELGRVVIPKEIRRTLRIREGDPLEIFVDREGGVILRKYSPVGELTDFAKEYAESIHQAVGHTALICDKDAIVAVSGSGKKELLDRPVSEAVETVIQERTRVAASAAAGERMLPITPSDNGGGCTAQLIIPIIAAGDPVGAVILLSREEGASFDKTDIKVCETAAGFMGRQLGN
ncbi:MAG: stage V sporulation protein T [Clostridia bacterium]|nr:stage V sporulation protein T [Clostridia bacterium]